MNANVDKPDHSPNTQGSDAAGVANVNASPSVSPSASSESTQSISQSNQRASKSGLAWSIAALGLVLLIAAAAALWWQQQRFENAGRQIATRVAQLDAQAKAAEQRAKEALKIAQSQSDKVDQLDAQVKVARSDFASIEQSWRSFNHGVDDTLRANEVERLVLLANQQLAMTGQVTGSIAVLEAAQQAINRFDSARFAGVGQAIETDLAALRATPDVDVSSLSAKLDRLAQLLNQAPLLSPSSREAVRADDLKPTTVPATNPATNTANPAANPAVDAVKSTSEASLWSTETLTRWWHSAGQHTSRWSDQALDALTKEFADIVRIRRATDMQSLLMTEEQTLALRAHLRGLVLSAKLSMMMRQPSIWQSELTAIATLVQSRFDVSAPQTKSALDLIAQLKSTPVAITLPSLSESLNAVASLRAKGFSTDHSGN